MSNTWWCGQRTEGERSISTRRNGSLTVRREKLAGIKKRQIENAYISDLWQPHSLFQIGHKFMIFHNCSYFDTSYFNLENEWEKSTLEGSEEFRLLPCAKLILNVKKGEFRWTLLSLPPFLTSQLCHRAPGFVAHWRLRAKLLWRVTPSKALHWMLDSWIFIHWLGVLIYQAATERNDGP